MPNHNIRTVSDEARKKRAAAIVDAEDLRRLIKTRDLILRVQAHALGAAGPSMTKTELQAASMLLRKTLPDLSTVTYEGEGGGPLVVEIRRFSQPAANEATQQPGE